MIKSGNFDISGENGYIKDEYNVNSDDLLCGIDKQSLWWPELKSQTVNRTLLKLHMIHSSSIYDPCACK